MHECPGCGSKMQGEPIPQESIDKGYYGEGVTHYSRCIGYQAQGVYDGVLIWMCPDCGHCWPRFQPDDNGWSRLHDKAVEIIEAWKNGGEGE